MYLLPRLPLPRITKAVQRISLTNPSHCLIFLSTQTQQLDLSPLDMQEGNRYNNSAGTVRAQLYYVPCCVECPVHSAQPGTGGLIPVPGACNYYSCIHILPPVSYLVNSCFLFQRSINRRTDHFRPVLTFSPFTGGITTHIGFLRNTSAIFLELREDTLMQFYLSYALFFQVLYLHRFYASFDLERFFQTTMLGFRLKCLLQHHM